MLPFVQRHEVRGQAAFKKDSHFLRQRPQVFAVPLDERQSVGGHDAFAGVAARQLLQFGQFGCAYRLAAHLGGEGQAVLQRLVAGVIHFDFGRVQKLVFFRRPFAFHGLVVVLNHVLHLVHPLGHEALA